MPAPGGSIPFRADGRASRPAGRRRFRSAGRRASAAPPLDARGLGTLVHAVLAEIDFARPGDVADWCGVMPSSNCLERDGHWTKRRKWSERFLASPRAAAIAAATRSAPRVGVSAGLAARGSRSHGRRGACDRYLQGFIDCLYLRRGRPVAAARLQDQSRDGRHAGRRWRRNTSCRCSCTPWPPSGF